MIDKENKSTNYNITIIFCGFCGTSLDILDIKSEILEVIPDNDDDCYLRKSEIRIKKIK